MNRRMLFKTLLGGLLGWLGLKAKAEYPVYGVSPLAELHKHVQLMEAIDKVRWDTCQKDRQEMCDLINEHGIEQVQCGIRQVLVVHQD